MHLPPGMDYRVVVHPSCFPRLAGRADAGAEIRELERVQGWAVRRVQVCVLLLYACISQPVGGPQVAALVAEQESPDRRGALLRFVRRATDRSRFCIVARKRVS